MATSITHYKPYLSYKPSGVEWLGEIPAHWEMKRLKYTAPLAANKLGSKPDDVLYVGLENIESWTGRLLLENQPETVDSTVVTFGPGDVLIGKLRPYLAKVAVPDFLGAATSEALVIQPSERLSSAFLAYSLLNAPYIFWLNTMSYGARMPRVSPEEVSDSFMPLPPLSEQHAIAAFLDSETAKIDELVAQKERLTELLHEKRIANISQAVTKGLDPNAPMRDSDVEWLGQIPAHWEGLPLKRWVKAKITDGPHETPELIPNGVDFISAEAVSEGRIDFEKRRGFISQELHSLYSRKCRPVRDDILVCKSGATTGKLAMVETDLSFSIWSPLALVRSDQSRIRPRFLRSALEAGYVQNQFKRTWSEGTQPNISMGDLERLYVIAPSLGEQAEILNHIDEKIRGVDELVAKIREAIDRLKELRMSLISAAVAGQIDVREKEVA